MTIASMVSALIMSIGISILLNIIRFKRIEKTKFIYISFGLFLMFNNSLGNVIYLNQLLSIVFIGMFEHLDNGSFFKGIITGGVALILCMITSSLISPFVKFQSVINNEFLQILLILITVILAIIMAFFVRKIYIILKEYNLNNISWKVVCVILIFIVGALSTYIAVFPKGEIAGQEGQYIVAYNGSTFVIYLVILMALIYVLGNKLKNEITYKQKLKEAENLKEYTSSLENMYEDLRKFRHDYVNVLSSIVGYIDDEDMEGLRTHLYTNILPLEKKISKNNTKLHLLKKIKIPELKGLISSKLIRAQELGINVSVDILEDIENIHGCIVTICRSLGILLDNAIEECETMEDAHLNFGVIKGNTSIDFIIENTCRENIEPIYILNSKGFSTKGKDRGLGLSILEELLEENENIILDTIVENKTFTQILVIMR